MIKDMTSASYCLLFFLHFVLLVFFFSFGEDPRVVFVDVHSISIEL